MRHTPRSQRQHHLTLFAVSGAMAATLTACGVDSDKADSSTSTASPTPTGAVTRIEAAKALDRYEEVNNKANKIQNPELLGTVEAGQVYEQSKADYRLFKTWSKKDQAQYKEPFTYRDRSYYIPEGQSWFAVKATASGSKTEALLIFDQTASRHFKMVAAVYTDPKSSIPEIDTSNHGLATAARPSDRVGILAPDQVAAAYEDLYETGGKNSGAELASTAATRTAVDTHRERTTYKNAQYATLHWEATQAVKPKIYALRLRTGGVLAVFPTAHNRMEQLKDGYIYSGYVKITPGEQQAVFDKTPRVAILDEFQGQALAQFNPASEPKILGVEYQMVDSR
ncbi:hypothetical protein PV387_04615 [Streptomyces sp. ME02-6987-2C]|uniref:hypothetical protein n=1 Tax=unclassified Streptomyces TaxID=2593676 RepID=UPI00087CF0D2|nr:MULTISPECIES: hypothetical protein [unclassified Streptomyces]MDX3365314.1 hypothetical protein [Streptomyces sp. ME02-6987-2C]MDX3422689.1 hypothetical protein [Streptomyces sp. ME02-6985-2c]REH20583.1 hypothetical protein BX268_2365 [Streptomyces sp. 2221.1]SDT29239.1 hypothetical protein SAMN05428941_2360 [Streptomyces sp. 2114.2]